MTKTTDFYLVSATDAAMPHLYANHGGVMKTLCGQAISDDWKRLHAVPSGQTLCAICLDDLRMAGGAVNMGPL